MHDGDEGEAPGRLREGEEPGAEEVLDAVGLFCPVPIIRTAARVRKMRPGATLEVRADDPVVLIDLPNWCRGTGHRFRGWQRRDDELRLFLTVRDEQGG